MPVSNSLWGVKGIAIQFIKGNPYMFAKGQIKTRMYRKPD